MAKQINAVGWMEGRDRRREYSGVFHLMLAADESNWSGGLRHACGNHGVTTGGQLEKKVPYGSPCKVCEKVYLKRFGWNRDGVYSVEEAVEVRGTDQS